MSVEDQHTPAKHHLDFTETVYKLFMVMVWVFVFVLDYIFVGLSESSHQREVQLFEREVQEGS